MRSLAPALVLLAGCAAATTTPAPRAVSILSPGGEEPVRGVVDVVIGVSAAAHAVHLQLWVDGGVRVGEWREEMAPELSAALDTTRLVNGRHELLAIVELDDGEIESAHRRFFVDNAVPELAIEEPIDRVFREDGVFAMVVHVSNAEHLTSLRIRVEGTTVEEIRPVVRNRNVVTLDPEDYLSGGVPFGRIVLGAEAEDERGLSTSVEKVIDIATRRAWTFPTLGRVWEAPELHSDGAVSVATSEGALHVVEPDGTERCHVRADGERGGSSPTFVPGTDAIVWGTTQHLRVTSAETCAQLYIDPLAREFVAKPAVTEAGVVAACTFDGTVVSFAPDGTSRQVHELSGLVTGGSALEVRSGLVVGPDGSVYVAAKVGSTGGALFALRTDGTVDAADLTAPVASDLLVTPLGIFFGGEDGAVYAHGLDLGRRWVAAASDIASILTQPVLVGDVLVVGDGEGRVHGRDPVTGDVLWEYDALLDRAPTGLGLIGRAGLATGPAGDVAFGDTLGTLHVLGPDGSLELRVPVTGGGYGNGIVARPVVRSDRVYVGSEGQTLTAFVLR